MAFTISCAPCCWGVDDPKNPYLPDWKQVLYEAGTAGYRAIELGPYGYLPLDCETVQAELDKNNLNIIAGTIFDNLVDPANIPSLEKQARDICRILTGLKKPPVTEGQKCPAPYLVLIDWGHDERDFAAGHPDMAPRLTGEQWKTMTSHIRKLTAVAKTEFGIRSVIHHHAGGYIEFADEIEAVLEDISPSEAGLLLDTGHLQYAKLDPVQWIIKYGSRIEYVHFKDVNKDVYTQVMGEHIRFFDAVAKGVMCPLGTGALNYLDIFNALKQIRYSGYITVEQERDPRNSSGSLKDVTASLQFLKSVGF
ncbi:MAG: TIM barrel protein [Syntrophomonadaceae bacterium]|jgi:inosose dehydratase|nr:TIM barrel protein [Syntrophomonadaceae bacterium]